MKVGFDGGIKLEFHGAKVTSDGGFLEYRDLDDDLGLFDSVSATFQMAEVSIDKSLFADIYCLGQSDCVAILFNYTVIGIDSNEEYSKEIIVFP